MKTKDSFLRGRIRGLIYAYKGCLNLITTEHSIMVQLCIGSFFVILGFICDINRIEWMLQIMATGLVLSFEGLNTAVEKIADFIHPNYNEKIGLIKDISAAAVFLSALTAVFVGMFIYLPIFSKLIL